MDPHLLPYLIASALAAGIGVVVVVVVKTFHRSYLRFQGIRTARYTASIGYLIQRRMLPPSLPSDWAHDALFQEALAGYYLSGSEAEAEFVDDLVRQIGIREVLTKRMRNRFSVTRRFRAASTYVDLATPEQTLDLRRMLADRSHHIAIHAATGLSRLGEVASIPAILRRAEAASEWHAARFADALIGFGPDAGVPIRAWIARSMNAEDHSVRMVSLAIQVLGHIDDPDAEKLLLEILESDEPEWRVKAAAALGSLGSAGAVPGLIAATHDEFWPVRAKAATSLGQLGEPAAADRLRCLLNDSEWWVRQNAAGAISALPGGGPVLVEVLSGADPFAADAAMFRLARRGDVADSLAHTINGSAGNVDTTLVVRVGWHTGRAPHLVHDVGYATG